MIDIGSHVKYLKEFLKLRDKEPVFDDCRENGYVGIPCFLIEKLEIDFAVKNSLGADKSLIRKSFPKEADQISLISTLVTYEACRREGMPAHSRIYMDRVTALRHHIDHYYGERSQQFCGS